jgi:hypothetical protein
MVRSRTKISILTIATVYVLLSVTAGAVSRGRSHDAERTVPTVSYFEDPDALAVAGSHVWVVNLAGNSVTELEANTGKLIRVINAKADDFHHPDGIAVLGQHVWISNGNEEFGMGTGNYPLARFSSVTELKANTGALIRVINAKADDFLEPGPIAVSGNHVWVLNANSAQSYTSPPANALIELDAADGSLVRVFKTNQDDFFGPLNLTATRSDVWVSDAGGPRNSVTEINSATGSLARVIRSASGRLGAPDAIAVSGERAWVVNIHESASSVAEIDAANGLIIRVIDDKNEPDSAFFDVTAEGSHVWLTNANGPRYSVTELDAHNGSIVRVINAKADDLDQPTSIVASGSRLWVLNINSVTELSAQTGTLVRVLR